MTTRTSAGGPPVQLVLSTGRCGSTILSNVLRAHPTALSVSELYSALRDHDLSERQLSGSEFWKMLSTASPLDFAGFRCQINLKEMLYPAFDPRPGANRFNWTTGLPPLLQACIPHLTDCPDDLYGRLEAETATQPSRLLSEHFRWLFTALSGDRRPSVVVERSGGSLAYAGALLRLFPDARVVHLFRDGRECAVSMSKHGRYKLEMIRARLLVRLGYDPYAMEACPGKPGSLDEDDELAGLLPERISEDRYKHFTVKLARYGSIWSKMIAEGLPELPAGHRLLMLDYADLVARPEDSMNTFLDFLGIEPDRAAVKELAQQIRPGTDVRTEIGDQQWAELTRTCRLGMNRLYGRGGWT